MVGLEWYLCCRLKHNRVVLQPATPVGGRPVHSPLSTFTPDGHLQSVITPDAV